MWSGEFRLGLSKSAQIEENLERAEIFLPLVSAYYFDDGRCKDELNGAISRYNNHKLRLVPILIRSCDWKSFFKDLEILPKNGTPVTNWEKQDQAYAGVVEGVKQVIEELRTISSQQQKTG